MNIPVAYEDNWLLIADKPAGLLSVPDGCAGKRTLTGILNDDLGDRHIAYKLHPCHRLDRETSGLIIYAKGKAQQEKMMQMFKERAVHKQYIAFVQGSLSQQVGQINFPLEGKNALTKYKVTRVLSNFSIIEVTPLTGRTNQIRIHFKKIGHPLVGESKFAFRKDFLLRAKRVCLHAGYLSFKHPWTGNAVIVSSPLPPDMQKFLEEHCN
ncbi:MAG: RluA family pseudouridine synthase [Candidatus Omnitrophota bacterium]